MILFWIYSVKSFKKFWRKSKDMDFFFNVKPYTSGINIADKFKVDKATKFFYKTPFVIS